jgi:hypothetical protein
MVARIWRVLILGLSLAPSLCAQERPVFLDVAVVPSLGAQSNGKAIDSDVKACTALANERKLPWAVNSAEFVQPPLTVFVTVGPRDSWRKVTVALAFCRVIGTVKQEQKNNANDPFHVSEPPCQD